MTANYWCYVFLVLSVHSGIAVDAAGDLGSDSPVIHLVFNRLPAYQGFGSFSRLSHVGAAYSDILNGIDNFTSFTLGSPAGQSALRMHDSLISQNDLVKTLYDVLSSPDLAQMTNRLLTHGDDPTDESFAIGKIVSSNELMTMLRQHGQPSSSADRVCGTHGLLMLEEYRQVLRYTLNVSSADDSHLIHSIPKFANNRLKDLLTVKASRHVDFVFSPVMQSFFEVFCELVDREINHTRTHSHNNKTTQAELVIRFQSIIKSEEFVQFINDIRGFMNSTYFIRILEAATGSYNQTNLKSVFDKTQNDQHNDQESTGATSVEEFVKYVTEEAHASLRLILTAVGRYTESSWRTTLTENRVSETCQTSTIFSVQEFVAGEIWPLMYDWLPSRDMKLLFFPKPRIYSLSQAADTRFSKKTYDKCNDIDAMGKRPGHLTVLPVRWLGSFDECMSITSNGGQGGEPFKGKYCRTLFPLPKLPRPFGSEGIVMGTCVPSTCSAADISGVITTVQNFLLNGSNTLVPEIECVEELDIEADFIIVTCILALIVSALIFGTLYDIVMVQLKSRQEKTETDSYALESPSGSSNNLSKSIQSTVTCTSELSLSPDQPTKLTWDIVPGAIKCFYIADEYDKGMVDGSMNDDSNRDGSMYADKNGSSGSMGNSLKGGMSKGGKSNPGEGIIGKILLSFSAYSNGVKILSTEQSSGSLGAINGIRFLSMGWVILGHMFYFIPRYGDNIPVFFFGRMSESFVFSVVSYAFVCVDSFFTIGAILVSYLTLEYLKKVGGAKKVNWFMFYFARFWRLTPCYMLVMMVGTVILPHVGSGPLWGGKDFPEMGACRHNWWSNLLFINNYVNIYPKSEMCMEWSWYLANDMQFYVLSPLIVLPLFYNVYAGAIACGIFLVGTTIAPAVIAHNYQYSAQREDLVYAPEPADEYYFQRVYIAAYCRMGPYIIGLITGYLLHRFECKCKLSKVKNIAGWFTCMLICVSVVFGLYSYNDAHIVSQTESDIYTALHRTGWGVAISWIVFACATGNGGWINDLLCWKPFIPLGRLTFGAYLVHPLIMLLFSTTRRNPTFFSELEVMYLFIATFVLSFATAFVVSLLFESPMMRLEKIIFNKHKAE